MPSSISIDASVAVKAFVDEQASDKARAIIAANDLILVPAHTFAEIGEIIYRKHAAGLVGDEQANQILARLPDILTPVPLAGLLNDAFSIAQAIGHSMYDCLYLAAAQRHKVILVTADLTVLRKTRGTSYSTWIVGLDSYVPVP